MPNQFTQIQSANNIRSERIGTINAVRDASAVQARNDSIADPADNESGYWNGSSFVSYFTIGQSLLGGTDGLK